MSNFEFDGQKYRQASNHQKEWGNKIIREFEFKGDETVLDLGCGDGILTKRIAELLPNGKVTGIDASEGMITTANDLSSRNLSFYRIDINDISFRNEFDVIFSNATLHWVKDHNALLENCYQSLKCGGYLRFNFAGDGNCSNFYDVIRKVIAMNKYSRFFKSFEWPWYMPVKEEYENLLSKTNFNEIKIWEENADRYFKNEEAMVKWLDQPSLVPFIQCVDESRKADFRNDVIQRMIAKTRQKNGSCFETFRRINIYAVKIN